METERIQQEYLQQLAKEYNLSLPDASRKLDKCLRLTSVRLGVDLSLIYKVIFSETYLIPCLQTKGCDQLTLDECRDSCFCVEFQSSKPGSKKECMPRIIKDHDLINRDPDKYIKTYLGSTADLEKIVERAAFLYYNYDGGGLTDNSFDALEYHLKKRLRLRGRQYEKIGAPPVDKIKVQLPYPMPSLEKLKPGTKALLDYIILHSAPSYYADDNGAENGIAWSLKLDGVSGMIVYKDGIVNGIYTRGNGEEGGDVTYLKDFIKSIPPTSATPNLVVRGEFILSKKLWNEKYKETYANSRNFVSGKINSGFISPAIHDIEFIAYRILDGNIDPVGGSESLDFDEGEIPRMTQSFRILVNEGFTVPEYGILPTPTVFDFMNLYKKKRISAVYNIDGLVLTPNIESQPVLSIAEGGNVQSANPTNSVAFKMLLDEQIRTTRVLDVEWNISRYGRYKPVAIYESVYVDGVRLHRATAHNAAHVRDWNMGRGTEIVIARSGDVIPTIKDVTVNEDIDPIFPANEDQGGYAHHWERKELVLDEIETNRNVQIKRMVHFFTTIGVPRLREKTLEKFWDAGFKFPEAIVGSTEAEMIKIRGIGKATAIFFQTAIRATMRTTPVDRFLVASTTLKVGIGRKLVKQLFREIPNIFLLSTEEIKEAFARRKAEKRPIKGFGPKRIQTVSEGIPKFRDYLFSFAREDIEVSLRNHEEKRLKLASEGYNPRIKGKIFVLTGFMGNTDYELEDYIYDNMGDFSSVVTGGGANPTEAVVAAQLSDISGKMEKAVELGIPVLSIEEFAIRYGVPLKRFEKKE